jgi:hypothetical protein
MQSLRLLRVHAENMARTLYRVQTEARVTVETLVIAKDEDEARAIAKGSVNWEPSEHELALVHAGINFEDLDVRPA